MIVCRGNRRITLLTTGRVCIGHQWSCRLGFHKDALQMMETEKERGQRQEQGDPSHRIYDTLTVNF